MPHSLPALRAEQALALSVVPCRISQSGRIRSRSRCSTGRYAGPGYGAGHRISDNMKKKIDALRSEGSIGKGAS